MSSAPIIQCLGLVSLISGVLIVGAHVSTQDQIRKNQEIIMRDSIRQLLPGVEKQMAFEVLPNGELTKLTSADTKAPKIFAGYDQSGKLIGVVLEASERGYADIISAMYAYDPIAKTVIGFNVVEMKETPGLGDKISKDRDFLSNFLKLDTTHPITAVKHGTKQKPWEIDAISGATISSRAVARMLNKSVQEMGPVVARHLARIQRGTE